MPKLCLSRLSVVEPFSCPMTQMLSPWKRPKPPTIASSSPNLRSPANGVNSADQSGHIVETMRPRRPARDLGLLPGREVLVELLQRRRRLGLEPRDLVADRHVAARLHGAQLLDLLLELAHRLFEIEVAAHHILDIGTKAAPGTGGGNWPLQVLKSRKPLVYQQLVYDSPNGCRSRTRLFSRSSSTWV